MQKERELRRGDGTVTLLPNQGALLIFRCRDCDRDSSVSFAGISKPKPINCDEERRCPECEKKSLVRIVKDAGSKVTEDELMAMSREQLLSLQPRDS